MDRLDTAQAPVYVHGVQERFVKSGLVKPSRIIAINVTGKPAVYMPDIPAEIIEISVPIEEGLLTPDSLKTSEGQKALYDLGYAAVMADVRLR